MTARRASERADQRTVDVRVLLAVEQLRRAVPGGIGTYARGLLRGLGVGPGAPAGRSSTPPATVELGLLAGRPRGARRQAGEADPLARFGLPVHASWLPGRLLTRAWDHGLVGAPDGYEVVHAVSQAFPPVRRRAGRPALVVAVHDLAWRLAPTATTRRGRRWHEASLARALACADTFVVPSEPVAADLVHAGADRSRVAVVGLGVDHLAPPDRQGAAALLARSGVDGDFLLSVGTLEPRKNLGGLVAAYGEARPSLPGPLPLVVVGPTGWGGGSSAAGGDELRRGKLLGTPGVVRLGPVSDGVLAALYAGARAFVYVPFVEGFGLPPVEAMSMGTPVVASRSVPSVGRPDGAEPTALLVEPDDRAAIAAALVAVTSDDGLRADLMRAAGVDVAGRTWQEAARVHLELWAELASARS